MKAKSLYICYFGIREPLVNTQVIPYLRELEKDGVEIHLLTFEPEEIPTDERSRIPESLGTIYWHSLPYHRRPSAPATLYDVLNGARLVGKLLRDYEFDILHCRIHVPALMAEIARKLSSRKPKILFDIRGFFPEEYTEAGVWSENGLVYRSVKRVERWLMKEADGFVVLTEKAREVLFPESWATGFDKAGRSVEVIPCCVDFDARFKDNLNSRAGAKTRLGLEGRFVVVHLGALGGLYLTREIADFLEFCRLRNPSTFAMLLTQSDPAEITRLLEARGFTGGDLMVKRVGPDEVPGYLEAADISLSFVKSSFSTLSRSPTKIPEYLACGVPLIANSGVGDVDQLIKENLIGTLIDDFSTESFARALETIDGLRKAGDLEERCRRVAREGFDLRRVGGKRYVRLYERLLAQDK